MTSPVYVPVIAAGAVSVTGKRAENQDCMAACQSLLGPVYVVADGMGGHRGGATASRTAVDEFCRSLAAVPAFSNPGESLHAAVHAANDAIAVRGGADPALRGMGSTLVAALFLVENAAVRMQTVHVGDSRAYLYRQGRLQRLTRDHTQVQWMVDTGTLDEAAARLHPGSSVLTQALGMSANLQAEISEAQTLLQGDTILLCTDGLSGVASSGQIQAVLESESDPARCAEALVQLALAEGSDDNITVQVLQIRPWNTAGAVKDVQAGEANV